MIQVIKKPVVSEKSMKDASLGWYTFLVTKSARKPSIAKIIEKQFGVEVVGIKTANFKSEQKRQRNWRGFYTVSGFKKAFVQLKKGQKIALFDVEGSKTEAKDEKSTTKEKKSLLKGTKVKIEKNTEQTAKTEEKK
ncbi:50S ribosomal protein L23 [Patescibacteria group bacterium]|nr:50S ribosomal protein L23 [Patescibacteria group bacterium]MCL5410008.1 50S ribosomal protein L23 [Patescibacteria group bacterium]